MSEMVERVAKAMQYLTPGPDGPEIFREEPWRAWIPAARAAIAAMREPIPEMLSANHSAAYSMEVNEQARNDWQAMIDAALK